MPSAWGSHPNRALTPALASAITSPHPNSLATVKPTARQGRGHQFRDRGRMTQDAGRAPPRPSGAVSACLRFWVSGSGAAAVPAPWELRAWQVPQTPDTLCQVSLWLKRWWLGQRPVPNPHSRRLGQGVPSCPGADGAGTSPHPSAGTLTGDGLLHGRPEQGTRRRAQGPGALVLGH